MEKRPEPSVWASALITSVIVLVVMFVSTPRPASPRNPTVAIHR